MNSIFKKTILSLAVVATAFTAIPADAGQHWRRGEQHRPHVDHRGNGGGDLIAAGILGLALGALAVGALESNRDEPVDINPNRHPRPRPDRGYLLDEPQVIRADEGYASALEPWSRSWFRYCENRYRTFKADTGTFTGYDGGEHFCVAD